MLEKGLYNYFNHVKQQLEDGKTLDKIIDEIYDYEKSQTKQEVGIIPKRTLPKNIYQKGMKMGLTKKPTPGEMEIYSGQDGEIDISYHDDYEVGRDGKKLFCKIKDLNMGLE